MQKRKRQTWQERQAYYSEKRRTAYKSHMNAIYGKFPSEPPKQKYFPKKHKLQTPAPVPHTFIFVFCILPLFACALLSFIFMLITQ